MPKKDMGNAKNTKNISVSEKNILVLLLSCGGSHQSDISSLVDSLYENFGDLYRIVNTSEEQLVLIKGMSEKRIKIIKSVPIILETYLRSRIISKDSKINTYKDVVKYFTLILRNLKFEMFSCAVFDIRKHVVSLENVFRGSISSATVYPREIIEIALDSGGSHIVIAHNHPSGIAKPSDNDVILTEALYNICCSVEITLIDHIIIAKGKKYSFKKEGMIDFFKENLSKNKKYEGGTYA